MRQLIRKWLGIETDRKALTLHVEELHDKANTLYFRTQTLIRMTQEQGAIAMGTLRITKDIHGRLRYYEQNDGSLGFLARKLMRDLSKAQTGKDEPPKELSEEEKLIGQDAAESMRVMEEIRLDRIMDLSRKEKTAKPEPVVETLHLVARERDD